MDIDPQALAATRANARHNAIADGRLAVAAPETLTDAGYDVILANILANPLIELAPRLAALAAPGARLCLSGILAEQAAAVAAAYRPWFELAQPLLCESWARLAGTRRR